MGAIHTLKVWISDADPATSTLSVKYEADTFYADLTDAIYSTSITITAATLGVTGYEDGACSSLSGESDSASNNIVVTAGTLSDSEPGNFGFSTTSQYYKFNGMLNVNGTNRSDGESFTVGGTTVTLYFPQNCFPYID